MNLTNRTLYTHDNLPVLRSIDNESVDLIYLDPPFNSGKQWENPIEAGGKKALASFKDTWHKSDIHEEDLWELRQLCPAAAPLIEALQTINGGSWYAYLIYMGARLVEMKRILKPNGSIYYHCDPVMSHGVKLLMDCIFGKANFRRELIWDVKTASGYKSKVDGWVRGHDVIFYYVKSNDFVFNKQFKEHKPEYIARFKKRDEEGRLYRDDRGGGRKQYLADTKGVMFTDVWGDVMSFQQNATSIENLGYPTQKPLALLERIIKASSNKGDIILDPFCGCATTCVSAEILGREWIGIDLSKEAAVVVLDRLKKDTENPLAFPEDKVVHLTTLPKRTDVEPIKDIAGLKAKLHHRQEGICVLCRKEVDIAHMDLDHIIPRARGGQNEERNYQLLCGGCNSRKGSKPMETARKEAINRRIKEQEKAERDDWEKRREESQK